MKRRLLSITSVCLTVAILSLVVISTLTGVDAAVESKVVTEWHYNVTWSQILFDETGKEIGRQLDEYGVPIYGSYGTTDHVRAHPTQEYSDSEGYTGTLHWTGGMIIHDGDIIYNPDGTYYFTRIWDGEYSGTVIRDVFDPPEPPPSPPETPPSDSPSPPPGFLAIQSISPTTYLQNSVGTATVSVANTGGQPKDGMVYFGAPMDSAQAQYVSLDPGASTSFSFNFHVPTPGPFNLSASADNSLTQPCLAVGAVYQPPPDSGTGDTITWTEEDEHRVEYGVTDTNGNPGSASFQCKHYFTYRAVLIPSLTVSPTTLKSGYGFEVDVRGSLAISMVQQGGGCPHWRPNRTNTIDPSPPDQAQIRVNWTVSMKMKNNTVKTQQRNTNLDKVTLTRTTVTYQAPKSPVSEVGMRMIYTDITLAGTGKTPANHPVTLWLGGGGIPNRGLRFDVTTVRNIIINGNMYEDDATGHN